MRKGSGLGIIIILLIIASTMLSGCTELSTLGLSGKPIPVSFDNEDNPDSYSGSYWVGTAQITGDDTKYTLTLPEGQTDGSKSTGGAVVIQISGINTEWQAGLEEDYPKLQYKKIENIIFQPFLFDTDVPYYDVSPDSKFIATAEVKVLLTDGTTITEDLVSYYSDKITLKIMVPDNNGANRPIYLKFQGINLASGDLPPYGDLSVVKEPVTGYRLVKRDDLVSGVNAWNDYALWEYAKRPYGYWYLFDYTGIDSWSDAFNYMSSGGMIPDRKPAIATGYDITTRTDMKLSINYPTTVFAPVVTMYIHEDLAETITINEQSPEFEFDSISKIEGIEGSSYRLAIKGTAKGTGTIRLSMDSPAIKSVSWVGGAEKQIVSDEPYTFYANIEFNSGLDADIEYEATVYSTAQGMGGIHTSKSFLIYLTDKDAVPASEKHAVRVYAIYGTTGDTVAAAPLYIGYGSDRNIGYGDSTKTGVVEGTYQIYSENITGWYPAYTADHPKTVNVEDDTKVEILFTTDEPEYDDDDGIFSMDLWLPVAAILILLGYVVMMHGGGNRILEPLRPLLSNPHFWIVMAILAVAVVGWFIYQDISAKADSFIDAIEGVKLI